MLRMNVKLLGFLWLRLLMASCVYLGLSCMRLKHLSRKASLRLPSFCCQVQCSLWACRLVVAGAGGVAFWGFGRLGLRVGAGPFGPWILNPKSLKLAVTCCGGSGLSKVLSGFPQISGRDPFVLDGCRRGQRSVDPQKLGHFEDGLLA